MILYTLVQATSPTLTIATWASMCFLMFTKILEAIRGATKLAFAKPQLNGVFVREKALQGSPLPKEAEQGSREASLWSRCLIFRYIVT